MGVFIRKKLKTVLNVIAMVSTKHQFTAKYSPWPLCAGLVAGVGGADVLAYLLDDGEQLRVLAGVEA